MSSHIASLMQIVDRSSSFVEYGKVRQVIGLMIESAGPVASIGDVCFISTSAGQKIPAEVVGFRKGSLLLMPYDRVTSVAPGNLVKNSGSPWKVPVGTGLIGTVLDGLGRPLEKGDPIFGLTNISTDNNPPSPLSRPRIEQVLPIGVKVIDSLFTIGKGQRLGIFAGSGVGKSTLLSMIAKHSDADINVIALIGERGREVKDFIERDLGLEGMSRTIVVAATSDQPALMRVKGAMTATAVAEYFRNRGMHVNLMMDSVTRVAMAQREIGLAAGEPPATKGYTPSVFAMLPRLLERSGTNKNGSITAFYTVLVDGDDFNEPIADTVRGILDGHIVLDRELANRGHFPAVNVLQSISRVMNELCTPDHLRTAEEFRHLLAVYKEHEDLISIGAYKKGANSHVDRALKLYPDLMEAVKQQADEHLSFPEAVEALTEVVYKGAGQT
ncbi:flagellar protein export ATPase FliI [Alkalicoccus luteus]|uniref:flagellar protein export ATPase FliI n=1 Tax=Alkalicoccus luteus TaxID=1237094 RepID=UPI00403431B6